MTEYHDGMPVADAAALFGHTVAVRYWVGPKDGGWWQWNRGTVMGLRSAGHAMEMRDARKTMGQRASTIVALAAIAEVTL